MTMRPQDGNQYWIQIGAPPNGAPMPHALIPVSGTYGGTTDPTVLIQVVLAYVNPAMLGASTGKLPPEDPNNQAYSRQFQNATPTQPGQSALLTASLYDPTGQILLAQSTTITITIV